MFTELLSQIVNRASGTVSCIETWNYSQVINVTVMIVMMLVVMIIHLTILTPSHCCHGSKWGLQKQQNVGYIVQLRSYEFWKFLGFTGFGNFCIKWSRKGIVRFCFLYLTLRLMCYHIWVNGGHTVSRRGLFFSSNLIFFCFFYFFSNIFIIFDVVLVAMTMQNLKEKKRIMVSYFYILWEYFIGL